MDFTQISSGDLLSWRKRQLAKGGRAADLDWLLDLGGGVRWSQLQKIHNFSNQNVFLDRSLEELENIWLSYISEKIPLQYLLKKCPWRDMELEVNSSVLIPRYETELLVDFALSKVDINEFALWADLGTGSGAIAVALAKELPNWKGHAVDISKQALEIAKKNLNRLAPNSKVQLHLGNWWDPLRPWWGELRLVLANPPYIPTKVMEELDPIVLNNEPHLALCGGDDGLDASEKVINGAMTALSHSGWLFLEHHHDQSDNVLNLMKRNGLVEIDFKCDLEGVRRFAIARKL